MKKIEVINSLDFINFGGVKKQIQDVKRGVSDELWLATPHEDAERILATFGYDLGKLKVFDIYTQKYLKPINEEMGIWWSDLRVPNNATFTIKKNWEIAVMQQGHQIARMKWFNDSHRIVKSVQWLTRESKIDYVDIYRRDGSLFSREYYDVGELIQANFYDNNEQMITQNFHFEGAMNLVYSNSQKYPNSNEYVKAILKEHPNVIFNISQLGREIDFSTENTVLSLYDGVLNSAGDIFGNLELVINNSNISINTIRVNKKDYELLKNSDLNLHDINFELLSEE